ncbi:MAG: nucleotide exchange factor GrpE [Prevotella bivia]|jgi:molecular chaperone GrpE|uniref:Protein GrpE n=2 Tax=Prevotella bivia TaxID=28125 RepID=A0A096ACY2_9BACT|nr:nucleotide exchange factor GrpE [Prevotella bivia]KGF44401.1 molecular chaperone GrpE [Prevotella bivia DNF00320]KXO15696.1 co-chaperone GrpE [Prevotella bivia]MBS6328514.1 nucleotide exchange factor GrpE [Prevotella bivia]MDK7762683.1 nucleotide exchange factor GrpE [Prevotella bivia]MDU2113669.1 nucleotide exchange factor GrpE [Prevotella bivia]
MSKKHDNAMNVEEENIENINCETEEQTVETQEANAENANEQEATQQEELDPVTKAQLEAEQWKDKYIRLVAEFDNYKKRTLKEKTELIFNGSEKTIGAVLPILDDFERAIADNTDDATAVKEGFSLIYKKFFETLEKLGVKKIETEDADFNVDYHEAIAMVPGMGDDKKGKVIDCVQTGYTLNDKVIRHAKVAVGQ